MATANSDSNQLETAQAFAEDYLRDQLAISVETKMDAFEEETLDLNIKSKFDDIKDDIDHQTSCDDLEQTNKKFEIDSHVESKTFLNGEIKDAAVSKTATAGEIPVENQNGTNEVSLENDNVKEDQIKSIEIPIATITSESTENGENEIKENNFVNEVIVPPSIIESIEKNNGHLSNNEKNDIIIEPNQTTLSKEDEKLTKNLKKMGISEYWWQEKHTFNENEEMFIDKFRTIKQNIKKGNTRSLKERFENFSKISEH